MTSSCHIFLHIPRHIVPCTTFCSNHFVRIEVRVKRNFHRIWIATEKTLVKRGPGHTCGTSYPKSNIEFIMTSANGNIFRVTGPLCGEFTGPGEFPTQRPVTRRFDVFFDLRLNKRLSKQSWGWWFETPSRSLWRHRNDNVKITNLNAGPICQIPSYTRQILIFIIFDDSPSYTLRTCMWWILILVCDVVVYKMIGPTSSCQSDVAQSSWTLSPVVDKNDVYFILKTGVKCTPLSSHFEQQSINA